jgi:predicted Zn-dependent protease
LTSKGSYGEAEATLKKLSEVNPSNPSLADLRNKIDAKRASAKEPPAGNEVRIPTH